MKDSTSIAGRNQEPSGKDSHKLILNMPEVVDRPEVKTMQEMYSLLNSSILDTVSHELCEQDIKCEPVVLATMYDNFDAKKLPKLQGDAGGGRTMKCFLGPGH